MKKKTLTNNNTSDITDSRPAMAKPKKKTTVTAKSTTKRHASTTAIKGK
jgi:hypothetical protein